MSLWLSCTIAFTAQACGPKQAATENTGNQSSESTVPKVYYFKEINPENLVAVYEALGREAQGKVAVKTSPGEPGRHNFLDPNLI